TVQRLVTCSRPRSARAELDLVDSAAFDIRQLTERERAAATRLDELAATLSALRVAAADRLARAVDQVLPDLGIPDGRFTATLTQRTEIGPAGRGDSESRAL